MVSKLPAGFILDEPTSPALPPGFVLDEDTPEAADGIVSNPLKAAAQTVGAYPEQVEMIRAGGALASEEGIGGPLRSIGGMIRSARMPGPAGAMSYPQSMQSAQAESEDQATQKLEAARQAQADYEAELPQTKPWSPAGVASAVTQSMPYTAAALGAGAVAGPAAGLGVMGLASGAQQYGERRVAGDTPAEAGKSAAFYGGAEMVGEAVPLGFFLKQIKSIGKSGAGKLLSRMTEGVVREGAGEAATEALQAAYDKGTVDPDMTLGQALSRIGYASTIGAVSGGVTQGSIEAGRGAIQLATQRSQAKTAEIAQEANVSDDVANIWQSVVAQKTQAAGRELMPREILDSIDDAPDDAMQAASPRYRQLRQDFSEQQVKSLLRQDVAGAKSAQESPAGIDGVPAQVQAATTEGLEVGDAAPGEDVTVDESSAPPSSPRLDSLNALMSRAQTEAGRKALQGQIAAERKRLQADAKAKAEEEQNRAGADELRALAREADRLGDIETRDTLIKQADKLLPETAPSTDGLEVGGLEPESIVSRTPDAFPAGAVESRNDTQSPEISAQPQQRTPLEVGLRGNESKVTLADGSKAPVEWRVVEADDISPATAQSENQARDRTRAASSAQVSKIANRLDYDLVSASPTMTDGAPVLAADGRVIAGNGRLLGITQAYAQGSAADYRTRMASDAASMGFEPSAIDSMRSPVLVRVLPEGVDVRKAALLSNEGGPMRMSELEQASVDAERLGDLSDLAVTDDGSVAVPANAGFIRQMLSGMPIEQQAAFIGAGGKISQEGARRLKNAVLHRAYGQSPTLERLVESNDESLRNLASALTRSAPALASMKDKIADGTLHDADITKELLPAIDAIYESRSRGIQIDEYLSQVDAFDELSPESQEFVKLLVEYKRSSKRISAILTGYAEALSSFGDPSQNDIFGAPDSPQKSEVLNRAIQSTTQERSDGKDQAQPAGAGDEGRQRPDRQKGAAAGAGSGAERRPGGSGAETRGPVGRQVEGEEVARDDDSVAESDGARYSVREPSDLFGDEPPQSRIEVERQRREAQRRRQEQEAPGPEGFNLTGSDRNSDIGMAAGQRDLFAGYGNDRDGGQSPKRNLPTNAALPRYGTQADLIETGQRRLGKARIKAPQDAADATAYLARNGMERLDGVVVDADGRPLAIVGDFKGTINAASVYPRVLVGEAIGVEGAAEIWLSHNHPSGDSQLSTADENLSKVVERAFGGTRIKVRGILAIGAGEAGKQEWSFRSPGGERDAGSVSKKLGNFSAPVRERMLSKTGKIGEKISDPVASAKIIPSIAGKTPGIVMLDQQNKPVAFIPWSADRTAKLRDTGALDDLYAAAANANASAAIIAVPDGAYTDRQIRNMAGALQHGGMEIRVLDAIEYETREGGEVRSMQAGRGLNPTKAFAARPQARRPGSRPGVGRELAERGLRAYFGDKGIDNLLQSGLLRIVDSAEQLNVRQREALGSGDALYDRAARGGKGQAYIVADRVTLGRLPRVLLHELGEHHGLEAMIGSDSYRSLQNRVRYWHDKGNDQALNDAWDHVAENYPELEAGGDTFVREVIARYAESSPSSKALWFQKLLSEIRQWLARQGFTKALQPQDMAYLVRQSLQRAMADEPVVLGDLALATKLDTRSTAGGVFDGLPNEDAKPAVAMRDAQRITGLNLPVSIVTEAIDKPDVPAQFNVGAGVIQWNTRYPFQSRSMAAEGMAEELMHAVDSVSDERTISASSNTFDPDSGEIGAELAAHYMGNGEFAPFLHYPLDPAMGLAHDRIKAELFSRSAVLYFADPAKMAAHLPKTYEVWHEIFRVEEDRPNPGDRVRGKVWTNSPKLSQIRRELEQVSPARRRHAGSRAHWETDPGLESLRAEIARSIGGDPLGRSINLGSLDTQTPPPGGVSRSGRQIDTPEFKRWFGDWAALRAQKRLDAQTPIEISVPAEWRGKPEAEMRRLMSDALREMVARKATLQHPELGEVRVGRRGADKTRSTSKDPAKMLVVNDLERAFPASIVSGTIPSSEQGIDGYSKLLSRIRIDGTELVAIFTVRHQSDGGWYYNTVTVVDPKEKRPGSYESPAPDGVEGQTPITGLTDFVRRNLTRVNPDSVSKVVDANGEPLVVYHGAGRDIGQFAAGSDEAAQTNGNRTGAWGSYFTPSPKEASIYAEMAGAESAQNVIPVHLSIQNPYVMTRQEWGRHSLRTAKAATNTEGRAGARSVRSEIEVAGHDGIVIRDRGFNDEWVAFRPEQIKSATGNSGAFDPENPSILAARPAIDEEYREANRALREQDRTLWESAKKQSQRWMSPRGLLPESVFDENRFRERNIAVVDHDVRTRVFALERAMKADYGKTIPQMTGAEQKVLADALAGQGDILALPRKTATAITAMRQYIDALSEEYAGILEAQLQEKLEADGEADSSTLETIRGNIGSYVHRSYRAFDDPNWFKKVSDSKINAARQFLQLGYMEQGDTLTEARRRAEVSLHAILKSGTAYDSIESLFRESKLGAKDLSVLMRRKRVPEPIRALLGEYVDPRINFAKSATKMGRLVWNHRFLDRLRDIGMGAFLFEGDNRPPAATKQIAGEQSEVYSPLNGLWTTPEFAQAMHDALGKEQMNAIWRAIVRVNGVVKYGKTVLSPTTAMRNFQSAMFFSLANGHFDATKAKDGWELARARWKDDDSAQEYTKKLIRLGVVGDGARAEEMRRLVNDSKLEQLFANQTGQVADAFRKANDIAQGFYRFGDDFWKVIGFENEVTQWKAAGLSETDAEKTAAERVINTYPTYSMQGKLVRSLSRLPFIASFPTFTAEMIRTSYHILRYAAQDLRSDNPAIRLMGARRAAGVAMVSGMFYALSAITKAWLGIDDDEEEAVRTLAPPWQKNSTFMYIGRDSNGALQYFDLTFLDPYGWFKRPLTAILRDEPWEEELWSGIKDLVSPFLSEDIAFGAIAETLGNKKASGGPVFSEYDSITNQAIDIGNHLRKAVQPGFIGNLERMAKASQGELSPSGKQYDVSDEAMSWLGWRASTMDPRTALYYRSFDFNDRLQDARSSLNRVLKDMNSVDRGDIREAVQEALRKHNQAFDEMSEIIVAAERSGLERQEIGKILRSGHVSGANGIALISGKVPPFRVTPQSLSAAMQAADARRGPEFREQILNRYRIASEVVLEESLNSAGQLEPEGVE